MKRSKPGAMHLDILRRGIEVEEARKALRDLNPAAWASRNSPDSPAVQAFRTAAERCRKAMEEAYPPGFWEDVELLKQRYRAGLRSTLPFLEVDPWFFRSGYAMARLVRYLKNIDLTPDEADRLRAVLIRAVGTRDRAKFGDYCKLARKVDSTALRDELKNCLASERLDVKRRAQWMLDALDGRAMVWRLLPGERSQRDD